MKITSVSIPADKIINGLQPIEMSNIGDMVLLAGKNGSGKTRLLDQVRRTLSEKTTASSLSTVESKIHLYKGAIKREQKLINNLDLQLMAASLKPSSKTYSRLKSELQRERNHHQDSKDSLRQYQAELDWAYILTDSDYENQEIIHFVPKSLDLEDPAGISPRVLKNTAKDIDKIGADYLADAALAKIQYVQNRWYSSYNEKSSLDDIEKEKVRSDYDRLKEILKLILEADLGRNADDGATIFDFPIGEAHLSDGQKILIQFALAIYAQGDKLDNIILFLDEPENHLHPSIIIDLLERIREHSPNGQIWIATHSIPLLAHFDPRNIWYVDDGKVSRIGDGAEKVLHSLLGEDEEIAKLQDFLGLPAQHSIIKFAHESLLVPNVSDIGVADPQVLQINSELELLQDGVLKVLDFGAGKGRLMEGILAAHQPLPDDFAKKFDYYAYDENKVHKEPCMAVLEKIYDDCEDRYFNNKKKLRSKLTQGSFDAIIMCNVLHEIDPKDWLTLFRKDSILAYLLSEKGHLLIIEDQLIPTGEKAYKNGFIVLDTPELKALFDIDNIEYTDYRDDGRLKCHRIPKSCVAQVTRESRAEALRLLETSAKEQIIAIRGAKPDYKNGRVHAFWSQQLANAILAQDELGS